MEDVGVDHGGFDVFVPEEFLYGSYVITGFEKVGGEAMAEGMWADFFQYFGMFGCLFD